MSLSKTKISVKRKMRARRKTLRKLYDLQATLRGPIKWTSTGFLPESRFPLSSYLNNARLMSIQRFLNMASKHFTESPNIILDLGCAEGFYTHKMADFSNVYVIGADLSTVRIKRAAKTGLVNEGFLVCDAQHLPFRSEVFTLILCSELIEHLPEPKMCMRELNRVLKKSDQLILTTPSARSYVERRSSHAPMLSMRRDLESIFGQLARKIRLTLSEHNKTMTHNTNYDERSEVQLFEEQLEHINTLNYKQLLDLLHQSGFTVKEFRWSGFYVPFIPVRIILRLYPKLIFKLESILAKSMSEQFLWTMAVICQKKVDLHSHKLQCMYERIESID